MTRIQFEIPEDRLKDLDCLKGQIGATTRTELFNNAMALLRWVVDQRVDERLIASVNRKDNTFRELEMPIFANIKPAADVAASHES